MASVAQALWQVICGVDFLFSGLESDNDRVKSCVQELLDSKQQDKSRHISPQDAQILHRLYDQGDPVAAALLGAAYWRDLVEESDDLALAKELLEDPQALQPEISATGASQESAQLMSRRAASYARTSPIELCSFGREERQANTPSSRRYPQGVKSSIFPQGETGQQLNRLFMYTDRVAKPLNPVS